MKKVAILSLVIALVVAVLTAFFLVYYLQNVESAAGIWELYRTELFYVMPLPEGNTRYVLNEDGTGECIFSGGHPWIEPCTWRQTGTWLEIVQEGEVLKGRMKGDILIVKSKVGQQLFHREGQEPPENAFEDVFQFLKEWGKNNLDENRQDEWEKMVDDLNHKEAKTPEPASVTATPQPTATPEPYTPANVRRDVTPADFDGTWKCFMIDDTRLGQRSFYQRYVLENGSGKRELGLAGQQPQRTDVLTGTLENIVLEGYREPVPVLVLNSESFVPGYQVRLVLLEDGVLMEQAASMRSFYRKDQ